jgi:hypothetical protein
MCVMELILVKVGEWLADDMSGKIRDVHDNHMSAQRTAGNQCIILWEDYWIAKPEIVKSRLSAMLGQSYKIPARLTVARRIEKKDEVSFLKIQSSEWLRFFQIQVWFVSAKSLLSRFKC